MKVNTESARQVPARVCEPPGTRTVALAKFGLITSNVTALTRPFSQVNVAWE